MILSQPLSLTGDLEIADSGLVDTEFNATVDSDSTLTPRSLTLKALPANLRVSDDVGATRPLASIRIETGKVTFSNGTSATSVGPQNYESDVQLEGGELQASEIYISGLLSGHGRVTGELTIGASGGIEPAQGTQIIETTDLRMSAGSTLYSEIYGINPGAAADGYDQLQINGTVDLGGATLDLLLGTFFLGTRERIVLIDNDGTDPVVGTFSGRPDQQIIFTPMGQELILRYAGGDGNDVTLSHSDDEPPIISPTKTIIVNAPLGEEFAMVFWPLPTVTDNLDPSPTLTLTAGLPPGSSFPIGRTDNTYRAEDEAGNTAEASFSVIVLRTVDSPRIVTGETVALRGDSVSDPGVPKGASFHVFWNAYINNSSDILLHTALTGGGVTAADNASIWTNAGGPFEMLAREGERSPFSGVDYSAFDSISFDNDGQTSFRTILKGSSVGSTSDKAVVTGKVGGNISIGREGEDAPSTGGAKFHIVHRPASSGGTTAHAANLCLGVNGVGPGNDTALFANGQLVAREGDPAPAAIGLGVGIGQLKTRVVVNDSGQMATSLYLTGVPANRNAALMSGSISSDLEPVAREGDLAPGGEGAEFHDFDSESINTLGDVAFRGRLRGTGVNSANDTGIWTTVHGVMEAVAREGGNAPCVPQADVVFDDFNEVFIADSSTIYFHAYLRGPSINSSNDGTVWRYDPVGRQLHIIGREGDIANSTQGSVITHIDKFTANSSLGVAYVARLLPSIGDTTSRNQIGLWLDDGTTGAPRLVLRRDDFLGDIATGARVTGIDIDRQTNPLGGSGGSGRSMNDHGEVVVKVSFSRNTSGVMVFGPDSE